MTPAEKTEGQDPQDKKQQPPIEISIKPFADAGIVFERAADGRLILQTTGEITIAILPTGQAPESPVTDVETATSSSDSGKHFSACYRGIWRR